MHESYNENWPVLRDFELFYASSACINARGIKQRGCACASVLLSVGL